MDHIFTNTLCISPLKLINEKHYHIKKTSTIIIYYGY